MNKNFDNGAVHKSHLMQKKTRSHNVMCIK